MLFLQLFFMCMSFAPIIGLHGVGPLVLNNAPAHLMGWSHGPIAVVSFLAHWIVTVELSETPGWLEEVRSGLQLNRHHHLSPFDTQHAQPTKLSSTPCPTHLFRSTVPAYLRCGY